MSSRSASARRHSGSLALSVIGLAMGLAANAISAPDSPVQLFASVNRAQFTPTELDVLVKHYDYVSGLSAGGYDFPGAIQAFRNANTTTPVLTYLELCGIHAANIVDDRYDQYDRIEDVFFHTTDPASLRVFPGPGGTRVTWVQDSRERSNSTYAAPGVAGYIVRIAPTLDGPWLDAAPAVVPTSDFYYDQTRA